MLISSFPDGFLAMKRQRGVTTKKDIIFILNSCNPSIAAQPHMERGAKSQLLGFYHILRWYTDHASSDGRKCGSIHPPEVSGVVRCTCRFDRTMGSFHLHLCKDLEAFVRTVTCLGYLAPDWCPETTVPDVIAFPANEELLEAKVMTFNGPRGLIPFQ